MFADVYYAALYNIARYRSSESLLKFNWNSKNGSGLRLIQPWHNAENTTLHSARHIITPFRPCPFRKYVAPFRRFRITRRELLHFPIFHRFCPRAFSFATDVIHPSTGNLFITRCKRRLSHLSDSIRKCRKKCLPGLAPVLPPKNSLNPPEDALVTGEQKVCHGNFSSFSS